MSARAAVVLVIGHKPAVEAEDGVVTLLARLGANVVSIDLWDDPRAALPDDAKVRAVVIEAQDRPDLAITALRAIRKDTELAEVPALLAIPERQVTRIEPSSGFDDFIVAPYFAAELYARIRMLEWRRSDFITDERLKVGNIVVDRAAHDASMDGRRVTLTAKEFALLTFLMQNRGRVYSRDQLLARVWGARYEGGARTVDIHVRRLRAKFGESLPLETLRGAGYKLRAPGDTPGEG